MFGAAAFGAFSWASNPNLTPGTTHAPDTIPDVYFKASSFTSNAGTSPINFGVLKNTNNFNFYPNSGDLLLAILCIDDDTAVITATGWTIASTVADPTNFNQLAVYYKYATGTEARSGTVWSMSYAAAGSAHSALMLCYRGLNDTQLVIGSKQARFNTPASINMSTASFTNVAKSMIVMATAQGGTPSAAATSNQITANAGFTELQEKDEARAWIEVAQKEDLIGSTAAYTATCLVSSVNLTWIGEIRIPPDVTPPSLEAFFLGG
jgi:hypothetical protein